MFNKFSFVFYLFLLFTLKTNAQPHILPIIGTGTCFAGRKFVIQSIFDLRNNVNDLECIFAGALAPDAIGLGFYYGTVLLKDNSLGLAAASVPFFQGDYVVRSKCNQQTIFLSEVEVSGVDFGTAVWTLAPFTATIAAGEAPVNPTINNIIMDFRQNLRQICPIEDHSTALNTKSFLPFRTSVLNLNNFVNIARVVGRDSSDNAIILLVKAMQNDPRTGWQTTVLYALKTFDSDVKPTFVSGTPIITPVRNEITQSDFTYKHNGFIESATRFGPAKFMSILTNGRQGFLESLSSNPVTAALASKVPFFGGLSTLPTALLFPLGIF